MKLQVFLYIFFTFILLEISLRLYRVDSLSYFVSNKKIHSYHPRYFVGLNPKTKEHIKHFSGKWEGMFTINSLGMRNLEEPKKDYTKVLCLGDSLVMGFGVSDKDTFCNILNESFAYQKIQFLNAGVDGLGSWGVLQRYKEIASKVEGIRYALFFISPNDFSMPESLAKQGFIPDDEIEKERLFNPYKKYYDTFQFLLTDWFYSVLYVKIFVKQSKLQWYLFYQEVVRNLQSLHRMPLKEYVVSTFLLPKKQSSCIESDKKKLIYKTLGQEFKKIPSTSKQVCPEAIPESIQKECKKPPKEFSELPDFTKNAYQEMIQFSKEKKIQLVLVIIPMQIEEIYCNLNQQYHPLRLYALQGKKFFEENQIPVIDLMPYTNQQCVENQHGIRDHYISEDGHLTKLGNQWVAKNLEKILREKIFYAF